MVYGCTNVIVNLEVTPFFLFIPDLVVKVGVEIKNIFA